MVMPGKQWSRMHLAKRDVRRAIEQPSRPLFRGGREGANIVMWHSGAGNSPLEVSVPPCLGSSFGARCPPGSSSTESRDGTVPVRDVLVCRVEGGRVSPPLRSPGAVDERSPRVLGGGSRGWEWNRGVWAGDEAMLSRKWCPAGESIEWLGKLQFLWIRSSARMETHQDAHDANCP